MLPAELPGGGAFPLGPTDVVLVSRGTKGAGLALAQVLACCGSPVAVIGRAGPEEDPAVVRGLEQLRSAGARIAYEVIDAANPADMAAAMQRIERRLGPVTAGGPPALAWPRRESCPSRSGMARASCSSCWPRPGGRPALPCTAGSASRCRLR